MDLIVRPYGEGWRAEQADGTGWRCAIGSGGVTRDKREGDGATPIGRWPLRRVLYRPDRVEPPDTRLPVAPLDPDDGWCDDPACPDTYNRPVRLPFPGGHEVMWREDRLYDVVVVLGHNDDPPVPGAGSAVFLHVARPDYGPTAGCVALDPRDLREALARLEPGDAVVVRTADRDGAG